MRQLTFNDVCLFWGMEQRLPTVIMKLDFRWINCWPSKNRLFKYGFECVLPLKMCRLFVDSVNVVSIFNFIVDSMNTQKGALPNPEESELQMKKNSNKMKWKRWEEKTQHRIGNIVLMHLREDNKWEKLFKKFPSCKWFDLYCRNTLYYN